MRVAGKPSDMALRSGVLHIHSKVIDFQKWLGLSKWQIRSHPKTQFGKPVCSQRLYCVLSQDTLTLRTSFSAVWVFGVGWT